ncbi:MAG: hypothetical protein NTY30_04530 [Candidatus Berkelbacteria bacterium]|nr:hypothetical protein [Candidatus Berkelbacteria bacterium]
MDDTLVRMSATPKPPTIETGTGVLFYDSRLTGSPLMIMADNGAFPSLEHLLHDVVAPSDHLRNLEGYRVKWTIHGGKLTLERVGEAREEVLWMFG